MIPEFLLPLNRFRQKFHQQFLQQRLPKSQSVQQHFPQISLGTTFEEKTICRQELDSFKTKIGSSIWEYIHNINLTLSPTLPPQQKKTTTPYPTPKNKKGINSI